jgi:hypothetical protein
MALYVRPRRRQPRVAAALIGVLTLSACTTPTPPPILLTVQAMEYQMAARVEGTVTLSPSGCYQLEGEPLVWPAGTVLSGQSVRLPGGHTVAPGDHISGGGGFLTGAEAWQLLDAGSQEHASSCLDTHAAEVAVAQTVPAS